MTIYILTMGNIHSLTGGYLYNMHMIKGLKQKGYSVNVFGTDWPWEHKSDLDKISRHHFEKLAYRSCVVVDSLVVVSMHMIIREFMDRLVFVGLIHLPTSYNVFSGALGKLADEELQALHHMSQVIVTGQFTFDLLCNAGLNPNRVRIVEPGTDHFPRKPYYPDVPFQLLCISNYTAIKAQDILIRALHRLTDWEWRLHLYGDPDYDQEYTASVKSLIEHLKMQNRIIMHGIVDRHEISNVFLDADLFIMPSLFESYGMTITESLAHGIPVVTTKAGNIPNTIPSGMGLLTEPANEEQLADAIHSLFNEPEKYSRLCKAASRYYRQMRSWEKAVKEFEIIIRKMIHPLPPAGHHPVM